ncbi:addiction module protein [Alteromonas macleodii]|uniref:Addiction module component family protein n=1 Tax=Alteromonas macleodii TaxID=28108 RepID=A0AB36FQV7_ALTMA|nr:addiction module protein [Alteromonas macleodii]OES30936.1 addiction module component family protein [Alteromonas macleodii]OES31300.1 addiction module component family protein [Alteromonas macleodii]OES31781.1 addiction module component family protein [Alteromonas macleodii]OES40831.1 addiction module component family protein [Alteromonas macleodii]
MSDALKVMLENIEQLSTKEKVLAAHCLLTAMDTKIDSDVESEWVKLAESRSAELESGAVKSISWEEIEKDLN